MQVIRGSLDSGWIEPASVNGIEMHGTGTALGDPIEIGAISAVFMVSLLTSDGEITSDMENHNCQAAGFSPHLQTF
jgi:3-oxoacyl-(acyl-carrier-protein) synthase